MITQYLGALSVSLTILVYSEYASNDNDMVENFNRLNKNHIYHELIFTKKSQKYLLHITTQRLNPQHLNTEFLMFNDTFLVSSFSISLYEVVMNNIQRISDDIVQCR